MEFESVKIHENIKGIEKFDLGRRGKAFPCSLSLKA